MDNLSAGILPSRKKGDQIPGIIPRRYIPNEVAGFLRNQWPLSNGIPGRLETESVAGFDRNWWPACSGICNGTTATLRKLHCQSALKNDPVSASNIAPLKIKKDGRSLHLCASGQRSKLKGLSGARMGQSVARRSGSKSLERIGTAMVIPGF
jgi:hypothetical protein